MERFITNVTKLLKNKNMSQRQLASKSNISPASLTRYLSGELEPKIDVVNNIAKALDVSIVDLIGEKDFENLYKNSFDETRTVVARNKSALTMEEKAELVKILFNEK